MIQDDRKEEIRAYNEAMWDHLVTQGDRWTLPVSPEAVALARSGEVKLVLTPHKPVPAAWFPPLPGCELLCLASGGGQQGPLLAAAGARVTVLDNAALQLGQDQAVARREGLDLRTVQGDMANLSVFADEAFDFIVHPCSNTFVPDVLPVWREAFRVLRPGGHLIAGFCNPLLFLFDEAARERGELQVRHRIPHSDVDALSEKELAALKARGEPWCFGHTLEDQIGGQLRAGFVLTDLYEDDWGPDSDEVLSQYIQPFVATRALKPKV
jgi:SAM-dependent methyltransferase